jgi:hypothetical protein
MDNVQKAETLLVITSVRWLNKNTGNLLPVHAVRPLHVCNVRHVVLSGLFRNPCYQGHSKH